MPAPPDRCDRRTMLRLSGATLAGVGTAGCLDVRPSGDRTVAMTDDFGFDPETAVVGRGHTVRWKNESGVPHTVTASGDESPDGGAYFASGGFRSERAARDNLTEGLVAPGDEYDHAFEASGTYGYYCIPHESSGMVGTVRVE